MALPKVRLKKPSNKPRKELATLDKDLLRQFLFSSKELVFIVVHHDNKYRVAIDVESLPYVYLLTPTYATQDTATFAAQHMALNISQRPS